MTRLVLTKIAPWPTGRTLAVLYLVIGLVVMPIMMVASLLAPQSNSFDRTVGLTLGFAMPFIYAVIGFVVGVIGAALYNGLARLMGGIPLTFVPETVDETPAS
ncbi:MAG: hypothetical protein ACM3PF_03695 [Bacteroidota bacterium]